MSTKEAEAKSEGLKISQAPQFISEAVSELKKVSFPTRKETMQATMVTAMIIGIVSLCLFLMDVVFGRIVAALLPS